MSFNFNLKSKKYYTDIHFTHSNASGKQAFKAKSKYTNLVENLNSQMRNKISYIVRKTKSYANSFNDLMKNLLSSLLNLILKTIKLPFIQCHLFLKRNKLLNFISIKFYYFNITCLQKI